MAHKHRGQAGTDALVGEQFHFFGDFLLDGGGDGGAVENPGHHWLQRFIVPLRAADLRHRWLGSAGVATSLKLLTVDRASRRLGSRNETTLFRPEAELADVDVVAGSGQ